MKNRPEENKRLLLLALEKHGGLINRACREVGLSRTSHHNWYHGDPEYKEAVDIIQEGYLDIAESELFKKIKEGDTKSIFFYLRYRGKKRGYSDNLDVTTNGEGLNKVTIEIIRNRNV